MHPRFFHIYHLIPIFLLANVAGSDPAFLSAFVHGSSQWLILGCSVVLYLCTIWKSSTGNRVCFLIALVMMTGLTLVRLLPYPAIAALISAIFCMITIPKQTQPFSYKRMLLISGTTIHVSFGFASLILAALLVNVTNTSSFLFFAGILAFSSVIFVGSAKLKLDARLVYGVLVGLIGTSLYFIYKQPDSNHLLIALFAYVVCVITTVATMVYGRKKVEPEVGQPLFSQPAVMIILFFTVFAALGALMLQMPIAQGLSEPHSFIDSLFTAMSAVCVTGLSVLDTSADYSRFGQSIILILIQIGGIGIVSLSAWVLFVFQSKRLSIHHEQAITDLSAYNPSISPKEMIKRILGYFFAFEMLGALILFFAFWHLGDEVAVAAWRAVFTAISAFCNAGFAIQSDSLVSYQSNAVVLFTVSLLIIAGGFAPLLVLSLPKKKFRRWNLQEKISVSSTAVLLVIGLVVFLLLEWGYSLNDLGVVDKFTNAWFQSVTSRTAGFNSVDLTQMRDVTTLVFMILMFIGGNPGSAAGGIKTVTAAVLFFAMVSTLRGAKEARAFNRKISVEVVNKAIAVVSLGFITCFLAYLTLAMTQKIETIPLLFETVSALGTVGLSLDVTSHLDEVGKIIIIMCMLVGRVGPITFVLSLLRGTSQRTWDVPQEDVYVS